MVWFIMAALTPHFLCRVMSDLLPPGDDRPTDSPRGRGGHQRRRKGRWSSEPALSSAWACSWLTPPLCPILCREDRVTTQLNSSAGRVGEQHIHQPNASKVWLWQIYLSTTTLATNQLSSFLLTLAVVPLFIFTLLKMIWPPVGESFRNKHY